VNTSINYLYLEPCNESWSWVRVSGSGCEALIPSTPAVPNCCCSKGLAPKWSNPQFLIFLTLALWGSVVSARAPECQKLKFRKWRVRPVWQSVKCKVQSVKPYRIGGERVNSLRVSENMTVCYSAGVGSY